MGMTYAKSFLHAHIVNNEQMLILEKSPEKAETLRQLNIGTVYGEPGAYIKEADLIVLAVKPQDSIELFPLIESFLDKQQLILSVMAGVKMHSIIESLGTQKVIRAMPNLPAQIGVGMTVFTSAEEVTRIELVTVQNLINATGKTLYVEDETLIDAATAVSGSGPAYIFFFMQSMIEAAKKMGFNQPEAELLSYQTFRGTIDLFKKNNFSCEEWISRVASRGGTTEAAFVSFKEHEVAKDIIDAIQAAFNRAVELSHLMD